MSDPGNGPAEKPATSSRMSRFGFIKPRIYPPVWLLFAFAAMYSLNRWVPLLEINAAMTSWPSWALLAPGFLLVIIPAVSFRRAKTGVKPFSKSTKLITTGLYRFSRNPIYLGMALALAGAAIKLGSLGAWIPVPLFVWIIQRQFIRNEEIFLTGIYGDEYREYMTKVRRWI